MTSEYRCTSCKKPVLPASTETGAIWLLEAEPRFDGLVHVDSEGIGRVVSSADRATLRASDPSARFYRAHPGPCGTTPDRTVEPTKETV